MQWLKKFFKEKSRDELVNQPSGSVEKIINDYGAFLDSPDAIGQPGHVVDAQTLPWPKEQIKQALFISLDSTSDARVRDILVGGLLFLPFYQVGVGTVPAGFDVAKFAPITDVNKVNVDALVRDMLTHAKAAEKWEPLVKAEQAEIFAALKSRGIDVDPSAETFYAEQLGNLAHQAARLRDAGVPLETYEHHFKQSMTQKGWPEGKQRAVLLLVTVAYHDRTLTPESARVKAQLTYLCGDSTIPGR